MKKEIILGIIIGIAIAITAFHSYSVYQMRVQVIKNTGDIMQIVEFLNKNSQPEAVSSEKK